MCWRPMTPWAASRDTEWRWETGVAYGLGVHPGDRGLLNYLTTMTSEDEPCDVEALERSLALSAVLAPMTRALDPMMYVKDDASY